MTQIYQVKTTVFVYDCRHEPVKFPEGVLEEIIVAHIVLGTVQYNGKLDVGNNQNELSHNLDFIWISILYIYKNSLKDDV